jgi:hypothetical protein
VKINLRNLSKPVAKILNQDKGNTMKYSFRNWRNQSGTIPVSWQEKDYTEKTEWFQHTGGNKGFVTDDKNIEVYSNNIGVLIPKELLPVFSDVTQYFDLKNIVCDLSKYTPGMILPWHQDDYPTYSRNMKITDKNQIVRIIVFLHDSQPGQQLWIEDKLCSGLAGSWFSWVGQTQHMAANLGKNDRYVIQITGHV